MPNVYCPNSNELCHGRQDFSSAHHCTLYAEHQALHSVDSQQRYVWRMNPGMKEQMSLLAIISRFGEEGKPDLVTSLPKILCPSCVHAGPGRRKGGREGGGGGGEGCYPTAAG